MNGGIVNWQQANYDKVKNAMRPGDVIVFGGKGSASDLIKAVTQSPVSHVAIVLQSSLPLEDDPSTQPSPQIIEATGQLDPYYGVSVRWLDERITGYQGNIWWLPLSDAIQNKLDVAKFSAFLLERSGLPFDFFQAIQASADDLDHVPLIGELTHSREDFTALFCSELVAAGLKAGGAIGSLNCSEVTPIDLCQFAIYRGTYYQIKGLKTLLPGYNTVDPEGWGE
jgi:hypothetical protein